LLELARALRGFATCEGALTRRRALSERAFQAVSTEVHRSGPLDLTMRQRAFVLPDLPDRIEARGGLAILHELLARHAIERLRVDARLSIDALHGLLELIVRPPVPDADIRTLLDTLQARDARGIRLNAVDEPLPMPPRALGSTPPRPSVSVMTARIESAPTAPPSPPDPSPTPMIARPAERSARTGDRADPTSRAPLPMPSLGERLRARLVELEHTTDDESYARLAGEIVVWATQLGHDGLAEDCYRAMRVLADHAVGGGGRTEPQARTAARRFAELASDERLEDLIDRALVSDESGVQAAQLLLQRREAAVPSILERLHALPDPLASGPLHALVITSGDAAVPALLRGIQSRDETRSRLALRLAGELQNPALLPALALAARNAPLACQIEAIRALCLIPGEASRQALSDALSSQLDQIAIAATQAIAAKTGIDAVPALLDVLETHVRSTRTQLCRAVIDVLGRLGDERAVPRLAAILERRPVLRRAHWHAIQLAAVDALAVLPTREARRAVERAASHAAGPVRDRARQRLSPRVGADGER
jgi:HEAT repeat protein